jgi:hypothetical protein
MSLLRIFFVVLLVCSSVSIAAEDPSEPNVMSETFEREVSPPALIYVGPGLAIYNGEFTRAFGGSIVGWGVNAGFLRQFGESGLYWGGDFGLHFWGFNPLPNQSMSSRGAVGVQFLPTLVYRFDSLPGQNIKPFFGVSMGPNFYVVHATNTLGASTNQVASSSATHFYFELLARPGVDWEFTKTLSLSLETKVGILNWDFIFLPQASFSIKL